MEELVVGAIDDCGQALFVELHLCCAVVLKNQDFSWVY
jgi:hypothetical protein